MASDRAMELLRAMSQSQDSAERMVHGPAAATVLGLDVDTDEHYFSAEDQRLYIDLCRELEEVGYVEKADAAGVPDRLEEYVAVRLTRSGIDAARE